MSRALRRQPLVNKPPAKAPSFRPAGPRPAKKSAQSAAAAEAVAARGTPIYLRPVPRVARRFVGDIVSELKKVTWPTREETMRLTVAVLAVSITIGMLLGSIDIGFNWIVDNTLLR
ncbi:MAG: preprotein translocase subunit SecE [Chloroflexota bacterium]|nr:preprotein translocase subunit SecE [Chloroflexota bacterium]